MKEKEGKKTDEKEEIHRRHLIDQFPKRESIFFFHSFQSHNLSHIKLKTHSLGNTPKQLGSSSSRDDDVTFGFFHTKTKQ